MSIDPRVTHNVLLRRIEPEVENIHPRDLAAARDGEHLAKVGKLHLATAKFSAIEALASNDEARIAEAALQCPALEREGNKIAARGRMANLRQRGGKSRGAEQTARSAAEWAKPRQRYRELQRRGLPYLKARRLVETEMVKNEFVLQATNRPPSKSAIRKNLPKY
jgi:hypothetical protein